MDTYHACIPLIHKGFLPQTHDYLLLKISSFISSDWHQGDKFEKLKPKTKLFIQGFHLDYFSYSSMGV